jgi:hypothetical protein
VISFGFSFLLDFPVEKAAPEAPEPAVEPLG